jgi:hypothetical protein
MRCDVHVFRRVGFSCGVFLSCFKVIWRNCSWLLCSVVLTVISCCIFIADSSVLELISKSVKLTGNYIHLMNIHIINNCQRIPAFNKMRSMLLPWLDITECLQLNVSVYRYHFVAQMIQVQQRFQVSMQHGSVSLLWDIWQCIVFALPFLHSSFLWHSLWLVWRHQRTLVLAFRTGLY